ncbi:hypothetical protein HID58_043876 [Brassica napus]|uniref:Uncharacterized protein n=1 Tax=Brassica napus TaxID=3708 RepID=A0ABQ8BJA6_BRANA|nr:hypothetical protein HID58_043876 [Brassica napus]
MPKCTLCTNSAQHRQNFTNTSTSLWLNSDLKTFTLDLHGLVGKVIQKTSLGYKNLKMTKGLARTTTDPNLQIPYGSCATAKLCMKARQCQFTCIHAI